MTEQLSDDEVLVEALAKAAYEAKPTRDILAAVRDVLAAAGKINFLPPPKSDGQKIVESYYDDVSLARLSDGPKALAKSIDAAIAARTEAAKQVMRDALYERTEQCAKIVENHPFCRNGIAAAIRKLNEAT